MDLKNMAGVIVGVIVAVLLTSTILISYIGTATSETATYTNEGMPFAAVDEGEHTIILTADSIEVDGEAIDMGLFPGDFSTYTIVYSEGGAFIRLDIVNDTLRWCSTTLKNYPCNNGETVTISINGSTATIASSDTTLTSSTISNVLYYISTKGDYVLALNPYIKADSVVIGAGSTNFGTAQGVPSSMFIYVAWGGAIDNLEGNVINFGTIGSGATYSSVVVDGFDVNTTAVKTNLLRIDSVDIDFIATSSSVDYPIAAIYTYFLAPREVVYDNPIYVGSDNSALLSVIPILVLAGVVVAVAAVIGRRAELF